MASTAVTPGYSVITDQPVVDAITALKSDIAQLQTGAASAPVDVTGATVTITSTAHAGRSVLLDRAAGVAATLPAATGSGNKYRFIVAATASGGSHVVKVANSSDAFVGFSNVISDDAGGPAKGFIAAANTDDTVTLNGTTTGGYVGDEVIVEDIKANVFAVVVRGKATGTEATPFSATV